MKQQLKQTQNLKQTISISQTMLQSIEFLHVDTPSLLEKISNLLQSNPFLENSIQLTDNDYAFDNIQNVFSLRDDLRRQLLLYKEPFDSVITNYLIDSLDNHGFLSYPLDTYLNDLSVDRETLEKHIEILQSLEPSGIAALDAVDSVCIQLLQKNLLKSHHFLKVYRELILSRNYKNIKKSLSLSNDEINQIYDDIKCCTPFPYSESSFNKNTIPDITITIEDEELLINTNSLYKLSVNETLFESVKSDPKMRQYFNEALFLIESINKRNKTLLLVANQLVTLQRNHFLYKDELLPCTLREIADITGFHESTISRTLNNKYFQFENEVYPLKNLLVSQTKNGDSSDSVKKAIVVIISNEDKSKPLSDEEIVKKLREYDLFCSRRTIAKYRNQLNISTSSKRKLR